MQLMLNLLKTHFGFDRFRPLQEEIIEQALLGKDAFVLMPTGGGKSLCYQLPALKMPGLTLVVSPLIALMKDQVDALQANGIAAAFVNSTLSPAEIDRTQTEAKMGKLKILYAAPERLANPGFKNFLASLQISLIAIDEAHCISEWGHDFRPDYRNLKMLRNIFPNVPVMALTATATEKVREDIIRQLSLEKAKIFISSFNRPNLSYAVLPKKDSWGKNEPYAIIPRQKLQRTKSWTPLRIICRSFSAGYWTESSEILLMALSRSGQKRSFSFLKIRSLRRVAFWT